MIGIICAEPEELEVITSYIKNIKKTKINSFEFISGTWQNIQCTAVLCGVGKVSAAMCAQTLILKYNPSVILNVGVAGGIDASLKIGDIVIAKSTIQHDFDVSAFPNRKKGQIPGFSDISIPCTSWITNLLIKCAKEIKNIKTHSGTILTGDQFVNSKDKILELKNEFNGIACEMESGSIAQVCKTNNIDFGIVKSISDLANNNSTSDFKTFIKKASENTVLIINEFIKSYQDLYL